MKRKTFKNRKIGEPWPTPAVRQADAQSEASEREVEFKRALKPSLQLLTKLGSLIVHADETLSPDGRDLDRRVFFNLLKDDEVQRWMKAMGPFLPLKRR
jgi:hypothetical protein